MPEATPLTYFLKDHFPAAGADLLRLLEGAAENAGLLRGDYFTIRDWLEIADYGDREALAALLLVLMLALEEGSLCVEATAESIARRLTDLVGADEAMVWARRILDDLAADACPRLIGTAATDHRPVVVHTIGERRYSLLPKVSEGGAGVPSPLPAAARAVRAADAAGQSRCHPARGSVATALACRGSADEARSRSTARRRHRAVAQSRDHLRRTGDGQDVHRAHVAALPGALRLPARAHCAGGADRPGRPAPQRRTACGPRSAVGAGGRYAGRGAAGARAPARCTSCSCIGRHATYSAGTWRIRSPRMS